MKHSLYLLIFLFLASCSGVKRSENNLNKGNYDEVIRLSIKKIQKGKNSKANKKHILLLEEAFEKAKEVDEARVAQLEAENLHRHSREIYESYVRLTGRQARIRQVLPLKGASFDFEDYTSAKAAAKTKYADYLYLEGTRFLAMETLMDARRAHSSFSRLKRLRPETEKLDSLLSEAHYQGTDFVHLVIENRTEQVIPKRLEQAILDFDTYKLDDFWTEYHGVKQKGYEYSFGIILEIRQILISPDRLYEKEFTREKRVADGWQYVLDENGNVLKDSLGNDVKEDKFKDLLATVIVSTQDKSVALTGNILYRNLSQGRNFQTHPIASEFVFKHVFAAFDGDEEALTRDDRRLIKRRYVDFPSNEQMIFDTSTDLKRKFAAILRRKKLR
jgi:hypothetical protein